MPPVGAGTAAVITPAVVTATLITPAVVATTATLGTGATLVFTTLVLAATLVAALVLTTLAVPAPRAVSTLIATTLITPTELAPTLITATLITPAELAPTIITAPATVVAAVAPVVPEALARGLLVGVSATMRVPLCGDPAHPLRTLTVAGSPRRNGSTSALRAARLLRSTATSSAARTGPSLRRLCRRILVNRGR